MGLLMFLLVGVIAGWLAGKITKGRGFGILGNMVIGVLGAMIGGLLFGLIGLQTRGLVAEIVMATAGALVLLYVIHAIARPKHRS